MSYHFSAIPHFRELFYCPTYNGTTIDRGVKSIFITYQPRISAKPYAPSTACVRGTLGANGTPNKLFVAFLCGDHDFGVQFLKDVGLFPRSMMCCKCESAKL